jgi:pyruvate formate lyase activating enzyme
MPEASAPSPPQSEEIATYQECTAFLATCDFLVSFRKTSLVDYPGKIASVLFFPGCGLRCPWCHNRELVLFSRSTDAASPPSITANLVPLTVILSLLKKRRAVLGGVVVSGGEPTGFTALAELVAAIHAIPLPVKLDTNGMNPLALQKLFTRAETRPDYIALDLKLPPERYAELLPNTNSAFNPAEALQQSAALIRESGIPHEYRTLALPSPPASLAGPPYLCAEELSLLSPLVDDSPWYFRPFKGGDCLNPAWNALETPDAEAQRLAAAARQLGKDGIAVVPGKGAGAQQKQR